MKKPRNQSLLKALATEIKCRRTELGISQEELAHRADLNRTFIGKLEVGQSQPSLSVFFQLAIALEVDVVDLVRQVARRATQELLARD